MKSFATLYAELDATTSTHAKVAALTRYFASARPADAAWAVYFLSGGKPRQVVPTAGLRALACSLAGIDDWLFDECYHAVGDLAETIALVLPAAESESDLPLATWIEDRLLPVRGLPPSEQAARVAGWLAELDAQQRYLLVKLIGGSFRVGVSRLLVQRALAAAAGIDAKIVAQRMMGYTDARTPPSAERYAALLAQGDDGGRADVGQPYPFFLAHALEGDPEGFAARLGEPSEWLVEWKYDGIRAQLVRREGRSWLWSRGEELITERFPEVAALAEGLPDGTVLDGEVLVWKDGRPAPFALLQQRIGRKTLTKKVLADAPAAFMAYDLLEWRGEDVRGRPQAGRRSLLEALVPAAPSPAAGGQGGREDGTAEAAAALAATTGATGATGAIGATGAVPAAAATAGATSAPAPALLLSPVVAAPDWPALAELRRESRARGVEGFMLKHAGAAYGTGRTKAEGTWWKWKVEPYAVDCILVYAQAGHGRRASVYTDYTFAVWNRAPWDAAEAEAVFEAIARREPPAPGALQLVAFAKAYSGLTDAEFRGVDKAIRQHTLEKFGPVRSVRPTMMFELGFEGIARSARHKSGIAVRFPRMLRIRDDKPLHEADTLQTLEALLGGAGDGVARPPQADADADGGAA